jgi:hypothetical protein
MAETTTRTGGWFGKQAKKTYLFRERRLGVVDFEITT